MVSSQNRVAPLLLIAISLSDLRGCLKSPILCHAEGSVSPPDDLRYARRVLSISVYVQNLDSSFRFPTLRMTIYTLFDFPNILLAISN
jgi:hypothetical protein